MTTQDKSEHQQLNLRFIALIAFLTALVAMSIDAMIPAFGEICRQLGAANVNDEQLILVLFFAGQMVGIPIFGPLSDSIGRKPAIIIGLLAYIAGSILCLVSWSFPMLLLGRFVQGFGGGGPRIVSTAMVRDGAKGAAMARTMSFVMTVFMLVPIFAPSIGQAVLIVAGWRYIFLGFVILAVIVSLWLIFGQEETLETANRRPFEAGKLWNAAVEVVFNRVAFGYTLATGMVFGVFISYLSVCRLIYANQYGLGKLMPYFFSGPALFIAAAMFLNGSLVHKIGMFKLARFAMFGYFGIWVVLLGLCIAFAGQPPLILLMLCFFVWFFSAGFTFGNFNAMAMEPMGHIAGMASAVSGFLSQAIAIALGSFAGRSYDGTITPLAWYFAIYSFCALLLTFWAEAGRVNIKSSTA